MKLTFLGTGTSQGVPMVACPCEVCASVDPRDKRLRTAALIEVEVRDEGRSPLSGSHTLNILIDAGPDFRAQMLAAGVRHLDAILLTHEHKDHTGGLDDVRAFNYFDRRPVDVYATERVGEAVRRDYAYAFEADPYPGAPEITLHTIADAPFYVDKHHSIKIIPVKGRHSTLPVTGFRIGGLAYLTDFNGIEDSEVEKLKGVEVLVVNALAHNPHPSHFNVAQAVELGRRTGARRTYLTHMSHRMGFHAVEQPKLPEGVFLAYDNLTISV